MVVGNFDVTAAGGSVTFANAGTWYDYLLPADSVTATGSAQNITLAPGEYHVYTNRNLNAVDTTTDTTKPIVANALGLKISPNPVINGSTTVISYQLPVGGNTSLVVYSMNGGQVARLDLGSQSAGQYTLQYAQLPVNLLSNGYYILKLVSAAGTAHVPFLVIHR
jgi:hypothetical protein